ncbi:MAG: ribosomal L7Ae/L30e/S12e/Gadd45 family protein [Bacillota bacterium]|nr:ribosomal L7Ae/L30e/S12e/Gadd45 family protein [Bacillota bacterium]
MNEKALNFLGLMRKANAIQIGETDTGAAVRAQHARLIVIASDASGNARKRAESFVYGRNVPLIEVPFSKEEISDKVGKNGCSMAAICDIGFADAFIKALCADEPEKYADTAVIIEESLKKANKLKQERKTHETNKRNGKRRKN